MTSLSLLWHDTSGIINGTWHWCHMDTNTGTKIIPLSSQHDYCNGVIGDTISIMSWETFYCLGCTKDLYTPQMLHAYNSYIQISSCAHMRQLCQYICLIWTNFSQQWGQEHWYTNFSHNWYMSLNKYVCHIVHVCSIALYCSLHMDPHYFTFKKKTTSCTSYLPCYIHICVSNKYAPQISCLCYYGNYLLLRYQTTLSIYI